jgi:hypothetical protein
MSVTPRTTKTSTKIPLNTFTMFINVSIADVSVVSFHCLLKDKYVLCVYFYDEFEVVQPR